MDWHGGLDYGLLLDTLTLFRVRQNFAIQRCDHFCQAILLRYSRYTTAWSTPSCCYHIGKPWAIADGLHPLLNIWPEKSPGGHRGKQVSLRVIEPEGDWVTIPLFIRGREPYQAPAIVVFTKSGQILSISECKELVQPIPSAVCFVLFCQAAEFWYLRCSHWLSYNMFASNYTQWTQIK